MVKGFEWGVEGGGLRDVARENRVVWVCIRIEDVYCLKFEGLSGYGLETGGA